MMSDPGEALREAIRDWYAQRVGGNAVLTEWYLIATGRGFDDDGEEVSHITQDWDASIVGQLGLTEYAAHRVHQRMDEDTRRD